MSTESSRKPQAARGGVSRNSVWSVGLTQTDKTGGQVGVGQVLWDSPGAVGSPEAQGQEAARTRGRRQQGPGLGALGTHGAGGGGSRRRRE